MVLKEAIEMRRTWWHVVLRHAGDEWTVQDVFVHGGRAYRAVQRAAAAAGSKWRVCYGPVRMARCDVDGRRRRPIATLGKTT